MSLTIIHTLNQWKIPIFDIKSFQLPTAIIPKLVPPPRLHLRLRVWLEHAQVWRKQGQGSGDWGRAKICQEIVTENLISDNWLGMNSRNTFVIQKQNNNANLNSIQSHFHYIIIFFCSSNLDLDSFSASVARTWTLFNESNLNISIKVRAAN